MANDFGHTNGRLLGQMILANLVSLPVLSNISSNWGGVKNGQRVKFNQEVSVPLVTSVAVQDYSKTDGYVASDSADGNATLTINKHKHVTREVDVEEGYSFDDALLSRYAALDANTLANEMVADLLALVVNPDIPTATQQTVQAIGGFGHDTVVDVNTALDNRDVTEVGRFGVLNATYHGGLRKDAVVAGNNTNSGSSSISSGVITDVDGVDFSKFAKLPANGESLVGFVGTMDSLAIATILPDLAMLKDAKGIPADAAIQVITDKKSGLSILLVEKMDSDMGIIKRSYRLMYGVGLGNTKNLQKIASA